MKLAASPSGEVSQHTSSEPEALAIQRLTPSRLVCRHSRTRMPRVFWRSDTRGEALRYTFKCLRVIKRIDLRPRIAKAVPALKAVAWAFWHASTRLKTKGLRP